MAEEEKLTQEELTELAKVIGSTQEEKSNVHNFLLKVVETEDTTKVGNLDEDELGHANFPVRTLQELSLFSKDIGNMPYFSDYFKAEGEIILATSLSKEAKLLEAAITSNRQIGEIPRKEMKKNKGWFRRK